MKRFFSITCPMYRNDQPVRMPLGIAKMYYDMPQRIAHPLKQHLIDHFNRKRYYEYHSGYRPVPPDHEQYIRQAILRYGWTDPVIHLLLVDTPKHDMIDARTTLCPFLSRHVLMLC